VQTGVGCRGKLLISIKRAMNSSRIELLWLVWDQSRSKYYLRTKFQNGIDKPQTMTQFSCKGVKQINNRISFKHLYHSYLSAFFISAGVPNGEFPEILIAKCRSRFYLIFDYRAVKGFWCLRVRAVAYLLTLPLFAEVSRVRALSPAWTGSHAQETLISNKYWH
jgi:hypothetical protein